jgi:catechol 2,3-dioxygenase-like lactoylglutathione lyase family enzyme
MADEGLAAETVCQVAIVVKDIEKTSKAWAEALGLPVPETHLTGPGEETHVRYRGKPTEARARLAFFDLGPITIELIEPVGEPSTWRDGLAGREAAFHHLAFRVRDAERALQRLERQGMEVVQTGDFPGGCYIYVDAMKRLGTMLELLASQPSAERH